MKTHHAFLFCAALLGGCDKSTPTDAAPAKSEAKTAKAEPAAKDEPAAKAEPVAKDDTVWFSCDAAEKHQHCASYKVMARFADPIKSGCEVGSGGAWKEGETCPKEKIVATCKKEMHSEVKYFYEGADLERNEKSCTGYSGTWALGSG
jgi:hypothetical protein